MTGGLEPVVVVGGSIAALVATDRLAADGRSVVLHLPERGVGGGFTALEIGGRRLDLGARLIELSYDDDAGEPPPLDAYRAGPHGHRPYLVLIDDLVRGLAGPDLVELDAPQVSVGGRRCSDYVLSGDLSGLVDVLDVDELSPMAAEAAARLEIEGPHGVFEPARAGERWERDFDDVGRSHTGDAFHDRLIDPLARKVIPGGSAAVIAGLHRKIWLPLFHPVTAWEACTGQLSYRPQRAMYSLAGGGMGEVVLRLIERLTAAPEVTIERSGALRAITGGSGSSVVDLAFEDGTAHSATRPIIGVGSDELFAATDVDFASTRVVATMVWLDVAAAEIVDLPSVLFATEPELELFRVTENQADSRPGFRTLCCELDQSCEDPDGWLGAATTSLVALGVLHPGAVPTQVAGASRPAYAAPSFANRAAFEQARAQLDALSLGSIVVGPGSTFGADTFNEQVIQGLASAAARVDG